jgi:hypothetical protein
LASSPGASAFAILRIIPAFCMSARTASATPGYWIFTATARPSGSTALCTCPIDAAAVASWSKSSNRSSGRSPSHSSSSTLLTLSHGIGGAEVRSSPSFSWYISAYSGGRNSVSMNEASCPIFIAAPFIVPSASTIRSAASRCRASSFSSADSFDRTRFAAFVPA